MYTVYLYYKDGRVEKQGEYNTWEDAKLNLDFVRDLILQDYTLFDYGEIVKERIHA